MFRVSEEIPGHSAMGLTGETSELPVEGLLRRRLLFHTTPLRTMVWMIPAYARYLAPHLRPLTMSFRTNFALAAGLALATSGLLAQQTTQSPAGAGGPNRPTGESVQNDNRLSPTAAESHEPHAAAQSPHAEREAEFQKLLNNSALIGNFTVDGMPAGEIKEERYEIREVAKQEELGLWGMQTRISYGDRDVTVPIAVQVEWAGNTPVIVLDQMLIPGLGTFSARVLFHGDRYAGTWQHDDRGGHLFGRIERLADSPGAEQTNPGGR